MAEVTFLARSTYADLIDSCIFDVNEKEKLMPLPKEELMRWILEGEKDLCEKLPVSESFDLRLIAGKEDYLFADTSGIRGTGTITATGADIVGTGTKALSEVVAGSKISVGGQPKRVTKVTDDTHFTIESSFSLVVTNQIFYITPRATEISSEVLSIFYADMMDADRRVEIEVRDINYMLRLRTKEGVPNLNYTMRIPTVIGPYVNHGKQYLKVYPTPSVDKTITIYAYIRIKPNAHKGDVVTDSNPLDEMFDQAITSYLKTQIYSFLKDKDNERKYTSLYDREVKALQISLPNDSRIDMRYTN
jgi:hypothetical protein